MRWVSGPTGAYSAPPGNKLTMQTASMSLGRRFFDRLGVVLLVMAVLGACTHNETGGDQIDPHPSRVPLVSFQPVAEPTVQPTIPPTVAPTVQPLPEPTVPPVLESLFNPALDLRAGPVAVPLELRIPSLQLVAPILGVGITAQNVMDAPKGLAADAVWQTAFWYRGSGIPGEVGTATLAGHVDDTLGRPALFAHLGDLRAGDLIVVHDARNGQDVRFIVEKVETYSTRQAADPVILAQIYGHGPVTGQGPQPAPDDLAHLTLITCAGGFVDGAYDHRLVVYATNRK